MKLVVVGGQARKVGKTLVVSGIIRGLRSLDWTAVKITPHFHGIELLDKSGATRSAGRGFLLVEAKGSLAGGDTGRFLAAGASRALLLSVQPDSLPEALAALKQALGTDQFVIIESNSILSFLKPAVSLFVLAGARRGIKTSTRRFARRADALVGVGRSPDRAARREMIPGLIKTRPTFFISSGQRIDPQLCRFVRRRLARTEENPWPGISSPAREVKEQLWLH
jgi:hypothetical protein